MSYHQYGLLIRLTAYCDHTQPPVDLFYLIWGGDDDCRATPSTFRLASISLNENIYQAAFRTLHLHFSLIFSSLFKILTVNHVTPCSSLSANLYLYYIILYFNIAFKKNQDAGLCFWAHE